MTHRYVAVLMFGLALAAHPLPAVTQLGATTTLVSVATGGGQGNAGSYGPSISADGRHVAFASSAANLVQGDTNGVGDVFVRNRKTGQTARVSVATDGVQGNLSSWHASISADGRLVAFESGASNLVQGDTNGSDDVFVHDRRTGPTTRVSVATGGGQGNGSSRYPTISADGRYVAFESNSSNMVQGDTNTAWDVFVHDRQTGLTTRVSVDANGAQGNADSWYPSMSADGRHVAFYSYAWNLVPGDWNGRADVFVHDRQTGLTAMVSVATGGGQGDYHSGYPSISADGRHVAFMSYASNLVQGDTNGTIDVLAHDRLTGETTRVSVGTGGGQGNDWSHSPSISSDGRRVAFFSQASNLVNGDTNNTWDVFVHDRHTGVTTRVSVSDSGVQGNASSGYPSISADGRQVAFSSYSTNLVEGDTNGREDVFVHGQGFWATSANYIADP